MMTPLAHFLLLCYDLNLTSYTHTTHPANQTLFTFRIRSSLALSHLNKHFTSLQLNINQIQQYEDQKLNKTVTINLGCSLESIGV